MKRVIGFLGLVLASVSMAELGSTTATEIEPGVNRITKQYHSCAVSLGQLADSLGKKFDEKAVTRRRWDVAFGKQSLQLEWLEGLDVDGSPVVFSSKQSFLIDSVDTMHKTVSSMASFTGHYVLRERVATEETGNRFLDAKFAMVKDGQKSFHLIPVEQYGTLQKVLNGGDSAGWQYEPDSRWAGVAAANASKPKPGVVRTGRGTTYVFNENGSITVYSRSGEKTHHVEATKPGPKDAPYASHKAILARQGVVIESDDPVVAIEVALQNNPRVMEKFRQDAKLSVMALGIHQHELEKIVERYTSGKNEYSRHSAVSDAVRLADAGTSTLPEHLRWKTLSDKGLAKADGPAYRVIMPFLLFRRPGDVAYLSPEVRLTSASSLHLQAAHANLGNFALTLEKQGLIAGGHLAFEYDTTTGVLRKVRLEGNGLISLAHSRGQALKLTSAELEWLRGEIKNRLPFDVASTVTIEVGP